MHWHRNENFRSLPWKLEKNPYRIWLSEIILQQTRAEQGIPYYLRLIEQYPTLQHLADANDEEVFRLWQGLGYYNRCKNLLATARFICVELNGKFPDGHGSLLELKGVGEYTAAAIASFAFDLPHAVVDGNVTRLLSRYFAIDLPIDSSQGKKEFQRIAQELLFEFDSAGYNQAIMDHGAMICKPVAPHCAGCCFQKKCVARQNGLINDLPVKSKKLKIRKRYFHYLILISNGALWIRKRTKNDIWQNLHEPLLIESESPLDVKNIVKHPQIVCYDFAVTPKFEGVLSQRLTHQIIESRFFIVNLEQRFSNDDSDGFWVPINELGNFAFPKTLVSFLEKKLYF